MITRILLRIGCIVFGYCFGLIQTAFIIGKINGIDIREHGSGNSGTTNALRVMGKKVGAICFLSDAIKCIVPMVICYFVFRNSSVSDMEPLLRIYIASGVILGHNFPFYMGFKGGKGIMATGGMSVGMGWQSVLCVASTFFLVFLTTHFVSLGSLCMYVVFVIVMIVMGATHTFAMPLSYCIELDIIAVLLMAMAFYRHRGNIDRLIHKNERKTYILKKNKVD